MPSGPSHWHTFWEGDDKPMAYLKGRGFRFLRDGRITHDEGFEVDQLDEAAIMYLVFEWDYAFEPGVKAT